MLYISRVPTEDALAVSEDTFKEVLARAELLTEPDVRAYLLKLTEEH